MTIHGRRGHGGDVAGGQARTRTHDRVARRSSTMICRNGVEKHLSFRRVYTWTPCEPGKRSAVHSRSAHLERSLPVLSGPRVSTAIL